MINILNNVDNSSVQKRVSGVYIILGSFVVIYNFIMGLYLGYYWLDHLKSLSVLPILIFVLLFIILFNRKSLIVKIFHVLPLLLYTVLSLWDTNNSFYGYLMFFLAVLLLYKYNFFKKALLQKAISLLLFLIVTLEVASLNHRSQGLVDSLNFIVFLIFISGFLYVVLYEDIKIVRAKKRVLIDKLSYMKDKQKEIEDQMERLAEEKKFYQDEISKIYSESLDLTQFKLSEKEIKIINELCLFNPTNKELAFKLNATEDSIKQTISRIYKKVGISRRVELIEKCKPYFIFKEDSNNKEP